VLSSDSLNERLRNHPLFENVRVNTEDWRNAINTFVNKISHTPSNFQESLNGYVNNWNDWAKWYQNGGILFP